MEDHRKYQDKKIKTALNDIIRNREYGFICLIDHDDQIVGYFILTFGWSLEYHGRDIFIDEIFIKKPYRGIGLGKGSIDFIERFVKENNINAIHLEVNKFNMARKLYELKGFQSHTSDLMSKRF
jgi:GNAT superfamily N-acetyltransferase